MITWDVSGSDSQNTQRINMMRDCLVSKRICGSGFRDRPVRPLRHPTNLLILWSLPKPIRIDYRREPPIKPPLSNWWRYLARSPGPCPPASPPLLDAGRKVTIEAGRYANGGMPKPFLCHFRVVTAQQQLACHSRCRRSLFANTLHMVLALPPGFGNAGKIANLFGPSDRPPIRFRTPVSAARSSASGRRQR